MFDATDEIVKTCFAPKTTVDDNILNQIYDSGSKREQVSQLRDCQAIVDNPDSTPQQKSEALNNARILSDLLLGDDPEFQAKERQSMREAYPELEKEIILDPAMVAEAITFSKKWGIKASEEQIDDALYLYERLGVVFGEYDDDDLLRGIRFLTCLNLRGASLANNA